MKKYFLIMISVIMMILAGCSVYKDEAVKESDKQEVVSNSKEKSNDITEEEETTEASTHDKVETEKASKTVEESKEAEASSKVAAKAKAETTTEESSEARTEAKTVSQLKASTEAKTDAPTEASTETVTEAPATEAPTTEAPAPSSVSYSPQNVVALATAKCQAGGMVTTIDDLNSLLADGTITQEEYDSYYPYDGLGYYSVFVETDLNKASTTSGRLLGSEDGIATYIANMLLLETGSDFLIEYAGTYSTGGTEFYEFRCYR